MARPTILSLFSGVGGLELGIKLVWPRSLVLGYVERDAYAAAVLMARMEDEALATAPVFIGDIQNLDGSELEGQVDVLCGGFPCQDISVAGRGEGIEGKRSGLWSEIVRLADEIRPRYLFLENVSAILTRGLSTVLADLAALGFDAEWLCLRASDVGAPHKRERWFCLAHREERGLGTLRESQGPDRQPHGSDEDVADCNLDGSEGLWLGPDERPGEHDQTQRDDADGRDEELADAECPECRREVGEVKSHRPRSKWRKEAGGTVRSGKALADAPDDHRRSGEPGAEAGTREEGERRRRPASGERELDDAVIERSQGQQQGGSAPRTVERAGGDGRGTLDDPEFDGDGGVEAEPVRAGREAAELAGGVFPPGPTDLERWRDVPTYLAPAIESGLRVLADGSTVVVDASRADQLRCCGNGVVPLQAAAAFRELLRRFGS